MADYCFSDDILVEILKTLPVKSLLRFRCVQKSWYRLIQSRYFIDLHSHQHKNKNKYLFFHGRDDSCLSLRVDDKQCKEYLPQLQYPVLTQHSIIEYHGTSRGLICFSDRTYIQDVLYLWNPIIGIAKTLPDSPIIPYNDQNLNLHPDSPRVVSIAFGYFPNTNDYKVIKFKKINHHPQSDFASVSIYSLSTNSWTTVLCKNKVARFSTDDLTLCNSVVVNGVAYWVVINHSILENTTIVCFDMENTTIREIMLPPQYDCISRDIIISLNLVQHFGELALFVVCINYITNKSTLDILILEKEGDQLNQVWTKKISTLDLYKVGENWWPVGFRNNGEIVLINYEFDEEFDERRFLSYDHEKKKTSEMVDDPADLRSCALCVNPFEENLVLLGN